jgi:carbon storage regulator CsrA
MLVLTRKNQERIHIGDNVTITIVRVQGNTVRVGIEAPGDVRIVRGEVAARDQVELAVAEAETPAARPRDGIVAIKRQPPLARMATNKLRLRLASTDGRSNSQPPLQQAREAAIPGAALTC